MLNREEIARALKVIDLETTKFHLVCNFVLATILNYRLANIRIVLYRVMHLRPLNWLLNRTMEFDVVARI